MSQICLEIYETESELETHLRTLHQNQHVPSNNASKPNPVAILSTAIKAENPPGNNFDSDSEGNTEETENSQTSESEGNAP